MSSRPELRNVEVRVRVRPGSKKSCVRTHSTKELSVDDKRWAFDRVYGPKSSEKPSNCEVCSRLRRPVRRRMS